MKRNPFRDWLKREARLTEKTRRRLRRLDKRRKRERPGK